MNAPLRKGWCPGALRPMPAKDGLLVRLRITGGILRDDAAHAIADLAESCGNGLIDLSARGNLQLRGVRDATLPSLQHGLATLGILDPHPGGEAVRNVLASPLAGLHDGIDIRPLTVALERRLAGDAALHALPAKFGFLIDDGSAPSLAGIAADVRFDWTGTAFSIGLGGTREAALRIGSCSADELVDYAARTARAAIGLFAQHPHARRMRELITAPSSPVQRGRGTMRSMVVGAAASSASGAEAHPPPPPPAAGPLPRFAGEDIFSLAAPFGRLGAAMLHAAADVGAGTARRELRLTPWRAVLVPGAGERDVPGFIIDPADPRLRVVACVGAEGCVHGTTRTHADAATLAESLDGSLADDVLLHISGCTKGCAKASPSPVTLVAREGRYDLVRNGRPGDTPVARGLDLEAARAALAAALESA